MNANQLKESRIKVGLSQNELAEKVAVTQATISNWEHGKGKPSSAQQETLKAVLVGQRLMLHR